MRHVAVRLGPTVDGGTLFRRSETTAASSLPDSEDAANSAEPDEIGKRIVLRDAQDEPIADLIVGKQVRRRHRFDNDWCSTQENEPPLHYVRRGR